MKKYLLLLAILLSGCANLGGENLGGSVIYPQYGGTGTSTAPSYGQMLIGNANGTYTLVASSTLGSAGSGTVTSVDMSVPTGLTIAGNPVTTSGTLALSLTSGYIIPKTASTTEWDTAYGWGNHASAGYFSLTSWYATTSHPFLRVASSTYANQLSANPTDCGANVCATAIDASGNLTCSITPLVSTSIDTIAELNTILTGEDVASTTTAMTALSDATWTLHNSYPAACSAGQYVSAIGDTLTCSTPATSSGGGASFWATSTDSLLLYPVDYSTQTVVIGNNATSTTGLKLEVNGKALFTYASSTGMTAANFWGALIGNASTASALAADPSDCAAGTCATAIAANGNLTCSITPLVSGGTLTTNYHCRYDGTGIDCDRVEDASGDCAANAVCMGGHTHVGVNETYGSGWNSDTDTPEKDDVYDYLHLIDTDDDGLVNSLDTDAVDTITEIAAALKDGSGDCSSGLICLGDHTHSGYVYTAGDALTLTGQDFDFDGGATPGGSLGGTWASPTIDDLFLLNNGDTGTGTFDFSGSTFKNNVFKTFTYATSTAWTGTTTIPLGVAYNAESWSGVKCYTDVGTLNVSFYDGTNRMNLLNASTTVGAFGFSTNNTFTASEKRYVDVGTPATSPTKISCTVNYIENN